MKIQKDVASIIALVSAGTMIGLGSNTVHAATNDQSSISQEADYPKLGAAEDAPTAPESDEANYPKLAPAEDAPKAPQARSQTVKVRQNNQAKQSTALRTQTQNSANINKPAQTAKSTQTLEVVQAPKANKKVAVNKAKNVASKKVKKATNKKTVLKKTSKAQSKTAKKSYPKHFVELKDAIAGSAVVLATGVTTLAVKKIKK